MATPVPITIPNNITRPRDDGYIIHVEFNSENKTDYRVEFKKLEKNQLFEYLSREEPSFYERIMTVTFKTPMLQAKNSSFCFCKDVLNRSIYCERKHYRFLGHSERQIREKTCYLMQGSDEEIHDLLAKFGDFDQITNLGLRAKAIGLLFATFDKLVEVAEDDVKSKPDVKSDCGFMYPRFSTKLRDQLVGVNYPSAVLVRYQGFESILVLKEERTDVPHQVEFRKSMQKLAIPKAIRQAMSFICVVDHSRPYTNGYLDLRLITFLVARGVSVEYLKILQNDYFDLLKRMCKDSSSAELFLGMIGHSNPTNKVDLAALRQSEIEKMIDYDYQSHRSHVVRTRILVPKARMVFGVCDPYNNLKNDECYYKPTLLDDDSKVFAAAANVVVACNPYYHPGDIQVLKLTHEKLGYENLVDCLVLPAKWLRPQAFECAGGELSGIKFFVSWDTNLIPKENIEPCSYVPATGEIIANVQAKCWSNIQWIFSGFPRKSNKENRDEMIEYFARFTNDLPSRMDKIYAKFARSKDFGPSSEQCEQLSKMLYQAANFTVDRALLLERLVALEQMEPTIPASSADEDLPIQTETSIFLEHVEDEEIPSVERRNGEGFFSSLRGCFYRAPLLICPGDEVWKDFDERAKKFVEEVQNENYCD